MKRKNKIDEYSALADWCNVGFIKCRTRSGDGDTSKVFDYLWQAQGALKDRLVEINSDLRAIGANGNQHSPAVTRLNRERRRHESALVAAEDLLCEMEAGDLAQAVEVATNFADTVEAQSITEVAAVNVEASQVNLGTVADAALLVDDEAEALELLAAVPVDGAHFRESEEV